MSGDLHHNVNRPMNMPSLDGSKITMNAARKPGNGRSLSPTSPLKLFGQAKKKINDIFAELAQYVKESGDFLNAIVGEIEGVDEAEVARVRKFSDRVQGIKEIIGRDRMKVAFFGRTSNGKSTVINAMLGCHILPSGLGHTTNCFLQVEGTDADEAYLLPMEGGTPEPFSTRSISDRASAISALKVETNTLIRICWPKLKCHLLKEDVVLVDSPGVDLSPEDDSVIDRFCQDADVFILVANAESTLMQTEKNFFHKVSERLSKPNIFVLNNRWDASSLEPEFMEEVRLQHMDRIVKFLADELKVVSRTEAKNRVYFVSAREVLLSRLQMSGVPRTPGTPGGHLLDGHQVRMIEFVSFEKSFEECLSKSAVQTKFQQHAANGKLIIADLRQALDNVCTSANNKKEEQLVQLNDIKKMLTFTEQQLQVLTAEFKDVMNSMAEEVHKKVSNSFLDEIRRLSILVDEFERPFHADPRIIAHYKKELYFNVDESLSRNLHGFCSSHVRKLLESSHDFLQGRLTSLLHDKTSDEVAQLLPLRDFEPTYRLDCKNLFSDFQEDLQFRFSLGIMTLLHRFLGVKGTQTLLLGKSEQVSSTSTSSAVDTVPENAAILAILSGLTHQLYSGPTLGTLAVAGVVIKAAGWQVLAVVGAVYCGIYAYERLTYTNRAKERRFKEQFVRYASGKLRLVVELTGSNCGFQFHQELQSLFSRAMQLADQQKSGMSSDLEKLEKELKRLNDISTRAKVLKNQSAFVDSEIRTFINEYLEPETEL